MKRKIVSVIALCVALVMVLSACNIFGGGGKKIAVGPPASETQSVSKLIFEAYGLKEGDYEKFQEAFGDAMDGLKDGNIDISVGVLGLPAGSITDLQASAKDVKLLGLSDEAIKKIEEKSAYRKYIIPKDSYDFLKEDVQTVTAYAIMVVNTDTIDEELAYELTKTMYEKAGENTHAQAKEMTLENALNGLEGLPIHPGSKRYFEEQGLKVDAEVAEVKADAKERKKEFTLGTGSQGGTYYPLGGEIAGLWNKHIDGVNVTNTETGASLENLKSIGDGAQDIGMTVHVPAHNALNGKAEFKKPVKNFAFIGHVYPEVIQIVTREATGINSLDDVTK
ncbi:TAXI family TRAP transporter solute-binding subunit [Numidum massiliense]|uniref:TAXI family TRAP transporter solute-binding subunit n=1 Tax=Numidum massiliense TaxID=1522315 RepID=UPI0006D5B19B|nr:TAXI family TRAP transporter solute-binding subunit [Numidum massiliense]